MPVLAFPILARRSFREIVHGSHGLCLAMNDRWLCHTSRRSLFHSAFHGGAMERGEAHSRKGCSRLVAGLCLAMNDRWLCHTSRQSLFHIAFHGGAMERGWNKDGTRMERGEERETSSRAVRSKAFRRPSMSAELNKCATNKTMICGLIVRNPEPTLRSRNISVNPI